VSICVVGYGKLGGIELSYSSDLDLVFLHDAEGDAGDCKLFLSRFVQRVMHLLSVDSAAGKLYEVDLRLRPSGSSGPLVTSMKAFEGYQREDAWTWEHQALLHSRSVAGDPALRKRFEQLRVRLLRGCVHREKLRIDVLEMRERMVTEHRTRAAYNPLKQGPGGIVDIEFLAQYWALQWGQQFPALLRYSDTIRQLESVAAAKLVSHAQVETLADTYRRIRQFLHHQALRGDEQLKAPNLAAAMRRVVAIWKRTMRTSGSGAVA
jgi:glutamate-ammonia-ligase adenylyltransferase